MKNLCFTLTFTLLCLFTKAQSQVSGKLIDDKKEGLAFANILLHKSDSSLYKGALTDDAGAFSFEEVTNGSYFISIQYVGFNKYFSPILEINKKTQLADIQLIVSSKDIGEVVVVAKKPLLEMRGDKLIMNIESSPIASQGTALDALRRAPGIVIRQEKEIVMRGKNGVMVMIDDKVTFMSEEDLLRFLQSMPASSIDRIEIINNPSSRYDAAGTSGIINIKLKKDKNLGFNGTASLTMAYGFTPKYNANINTNYRTKKYNIFANLTPGRWQNKNVQLFERDFYQSAQKTTFNQNFTEYYGDKDGQAKVGVDFFLNDKTTLGLMTTAYGSKSINNMDNTINILGYNPDVYDKITATGNGIDNSNRMAYNVNFKRVLDTLGRELTLDADFSTFNKDATNLVDNRYTSGSESNVTKLPFIIRSDANTNLKVFAIKADYVRPLKDKSTLEMGWKSSLVSIGNGIGFETSADNTNWKPFTSRNNDFEYKENINAAYLNYTKPFNVKWNLQTGLRIENTNNEGRSITLDSTVIGRYTNLFPSANLTYTANAKNMFNFAYSLRIDRPSYQDLNPFLFYIDEFTFGKGNPFLKPQYTNSFTLTHTYMEMFTTTVFYSRTKNNITQVLGQEPNSKNAFQTNINLANFDNFSFTLGSPIPIQKWWNGYASFTGFHNSYKAEYQGNTIDNSQWSYNFYVENNFTLPKKWTVQASCWYNSSLVYGVFKLKPQYSVDLGCSKKINDRAKLKFSITDIFQTNRNKIDVDDNGLLLRMRGINETRRASLTFAYNFGNMNVKAARNRSTATEDEMNRVKKK